MKKHIIAAALPLVAALPLSVVGAAAPTAKIIKASAAAIALKLGPMPLARTVILEAAADRYGERARLKRCALPRHAN